MTIDQVKKSKESEDKVEFKEAQSQYSYNSGRKSVLGYIVALANENGGKLILGVKENKSGLHQIVGSGAWDGAEGKLTEDIYRDLQVRVTTEVLFEGTNRVLVIHVPSRPVGKALKFQDVPLMRVGEDLHPMSDEQLFKILQEQEPDFSAKFCEGLTLGDLDQGAIEKMKERYSIKQGNPSFQSKGTEQVLSDLKLLSNGRLTYAALILLGKRKAIQHYLPQASVTWEFRFAEGQITHDFRENICLPLFIGIGYIWKFINEKNGRIPIREGAFISDLMAFNEEVIREALLNAIAHRDYSVTSEVVIKQYPREMIINNPGGFPKGVTIENLLTVSSTPRSRLMAEVLEKTGLVERSGQGVDKIYAYTLAEGKPMPSYQDSDMFQVSLKLSGIVEDKAFHIFITEVQKRRKPEELLGAEQIIALYKVKQGLSAQVKSELIATLEKQKLIVRAGGNTLRYVLPDSYSQLASKEQRIGKRYITREVEQFLTVLQGSTLKIAEIEQALAGSLNRNQLKYLISKLWEDHIVDTEGSSRATRYRIKIPFDTLSGDALSDAVIKVLREKHGAEES
ncbi:MAG: putative DNA binding domain-containing protein [Chitinophagaceae bacterium]|nr:putative DNA binding domain-containing protein [Chitinophagaceae bacterium]